MQFCSPSSYKLAIDRQVTETFAFSLFTKLAVYKLAIDRQVTETKRKTGPGRGDWYKLAIDRQVTETFDGCKGLRINKVQISN